MFLSLCKLIPRAKGNKSQQNDCQISGVYEAICYSPLVSQSFQLCFFKPNPLIKFEESLDGEMSVILNKLMEDFITLYLCNHVVNCCVQ